MQAWAWLIYLNERAWASFYRVELRATYERLGSFAALFAYVAIESKVTGLNLNKFQFLFKFSDITILDKFGVTDYIL